MAWNWQNPEWPNFKWDRSRMSAAEEQFLIGAGVVIGTAKHLGEDERNQLFVEVMSGEALTTSEIEGEILNRASVQSSIQRQLGLAADKRRATPAEQGIAEMGSWRESGKVCVLRGFLKSNEVGSRGGQPLYFQQQVVEVSVSASTSEQRFDIAVDRLHHSQPHLGPAVVQDSLHMT